MHDKSAICLGKGLAVLNHLDRKGFSHFIFSSGMLFGSMEKWWNSPGTRPGPHEGIDIYSFRTLSGRIVRLDGMTKVPSLFPARVVCLMDDFIAQTIVLCPLNEEIDDFYFFFAHIMPEAGVSAGSRFLPGTCFGRIAPVTDESCIPAHLHISVAKRSGLPAVEDLSWPRLNCEAMDAFVDPMRFFTF